MMCAAALCVNKSLFGYPKEGSSGSPASPADTITALADGSLVIHTRALTSAAGYAGPVPLDVTIAPDGKIAAITPIVNAESPHFFKRAASLLDRYIGLTPAQAADLEVDAVSGATYSSAALIANVNAAAACYQADGAKAAARRRPAAPWKMWVALAVTLSACILPLFVKGKIYRNVQLAANVAVLGFWCGQFLDYSLMLKYLSSGMEFPVALTAVCMLAAAFIYPLFGRPQHYCMNICPLGSAQMLMAQVCGRKIPIAPRVLRGLDLFRKILWAALMLLLWADVATGWMDLELFRAFMPESAPVGIIVAALIFVALSAVVNRPYCRFICPTGALIKRAENLG